eukprot:Rmarinus@m.23931
MSLEQNSESAELLDEVTNLRERCVESEHAIQILQTALRRANQRLEEERLQREALELKYTVTADLFKKSEESILEHEKECLQLKLQRDFLNMKLETCNRRLESQRLAARSEQEQLYDAVQELISRVYSEIPFAYPLSEKSVSNISSEYLKLRESVAKGLLKDDAYLSGRNRERWLGICQRVARWCDSLRISSAKVLVPLSVGAYCEVVALKTFVTPPQPYHVDSMREYSTQAVLIQSRSEALYDVPYDFVVDAVLHQRPPSHAAAKEESSDNTVCGLESESKVSKSS